MDNKYDRLEDIPDSPEESKGLVMKGFYRIQISEKDGRIVGDSGWHKNTIPTAGLQYFISKTVAALAGSSQVQYGALGSSTAPATNATSLTGEFNWSTPKRQLIASSNVGYSSRTASNSADSVEFHWTMYSTNSFISTTSTLNNVGLFAETASTGTIFCGGTFASSTVGTAQNINCSYQVQFSCT